ncbi:MAG: GNAT family N-acetyltransferase [Acidobacteriota bacterium]
MIDYKVVTALRLSSEPGQQSIPTIAAGEVGRALALQGTELDLDQAIDLYVASTLGERRPVADRARMATMFRHANLIITAWEGELLVGISRSVTDFVWYTYLADLAVRLSHQRQGIGKELMRLTQAAAPQASLLLRAAPAAAHYYEHVGFTNAPNSWVLLPHERIS